MRSIDKHPDLFYLRRRGYRQARRMMAALQRKYRKRYILEHVYKRVHEALQPGWYAVACKPEGAVNAELHAWLEAKPVLAAISIY